MKSDGQRIRNRIGALEKRANFLAFRIAGTQQDLSYDKAELAALQWAIPLLRGMFSDVLARRETPFKLGARC